MMMSTRMPSVASVLLVLVAACSAVGDAVALHPNSAWTNLPKPPLKHKHGHLQPHFEHSKCGHLDVCEKCVHEDGEWKKMPDQGKSCDDGYFCNGREECNRHGKCVTVRHSVPKCTKDNTHFGKIDEQCGKPVCSERHKSCKMAINPRHCNDGDQCTTHDRCDIVDGSCYGIPKLCDSGHCEGGDCVDKADTPAHECGEKVCKFGKCKWTGCAGGADCKDGMCMELEKTCPPCHEWEGGRCKSVCKPGQQCNPEDGTCEDAVCKTSFEVVCYKCGNSNPLSCLVLGSPTHTQLTRIQHGIAADCTTRVNGKMRNCAGQRCDKGIIVSKAPKRDVEGLDAGWGVARGGKQQCLWPFEKDNACPCLDDKSNGLDNISRFQVCMDAKLVVVIDSEESQCKRECNMNRNEEKDIPACMTDVCEEIYGEGSLLCSNGENACPQPSHCPNVVHPLALNE